MIVNSGIFKNIPESLIPGNDGWFAVVYHIYLAAESAPLCGLFM